jgi:hypothetical protein
VKGELCSTTYRGGSCANCGKRVGPFPQIGHLYRYGRRSLDRVGKILWLKGRYCGWECATEAQRKLGVDIL